MSGAEVAGDLVDAAIVARVAEPHAVAASPDDGHTQETACLNCAAPLAGAFCAECGQAAHVHRTLGAFFHDLLHGVFHFEGRVWHTLPLLALHPGQLTRRYIDGQRARFVSPLALFLFCVFLMFAAIQQTTNDTKMTLQSGDDKPVSTDAAVKTRFEKLAAQRSTLVARHEDTNDVDAQIAGLRMVAAVVGKDQPRANGAAPVITGVATLDAGVAKVKENPELAFYKVETHAYKYSWLLIPISVPFVWLLFPFSRRFKLYDHTVFVTYSLSFMTLLCVAIILAGALGWESAAALLVFLPPLHMYLQLRGAYGCSRGGALVRTFALLGFAAIALLIFFAVIVAESADVPLIHVGS
jgi:hypothetical protein